jgi:hypothetical protein
LSPTTIILGPAPADVESAGVIDLAALGSILVDYTAADGRHLVVATRQGKARLWVRAPQPTPALVILIPVDKYVVTRAAAVARFAGTLSSKAGEPKPSAFLPSRFQRHRLALLRALLDAEQGGATRREMVIHLLYRNSMLMRRAEWTGSSQRRRAHRMVNQARQLAKQGYLDLLCAT